MIELQIDTHLYDHLNMPALQRALAVQLPLVEQLGSIRASIVGMHIYQFTLSSNPAYLDRVVLLLKEYSADWPSAIRGEIERSAAARETGASSDWHSAYRNEAEHLLLLAALSRPATEDIAQLLRHYQLYACSHLLGADNRPAYLKLEEIDALLAPNTTYSVSLFARQFSERQRKPELIIRELETHFAPFDTAL